MCASVVPAGFLTSPLSWRTVGSSVVGTLGGALQALRMRKRKIPSSLLAIDMCHLADPAQKDSFFNKHKQRIQKPVSIQFRNVLFLPK